MPDASILRSTRLARVSLTGLLLGASLSLGASAASGPAVNAARIEAADSEPQNWLTHGRTYSEQRFSPLDSVNDGNVARLGLDWYFDLPDPRGIEATPIVVDGVMYVTGAWSKIFALDASNGKLLWSYDPQVPPQWAVNLCCDVVNRGVAVWEGKIYAGTLDGRLLALDATDGSLVWEVQTTPKDRPYSITGAPRIVKGKVMIGNGGAELGVRGYVSAYDADDGEMAWRFYTVPGDPSRPLENTALKQALPTWKGGKWWEVGGGGTVWDSMAYDPELDILYIGVGNGSPWNRAIRSPGGGDNLYLSSIVALKPDTGEYVWHYQTTPGESWDYTATQHMILAELEIGGKARKVIMQAPKNGFFYVLDRSTGELLSADPYTRVTWASKIDLATGRPVENPEARYESTGQPALVWPHALGGHNWHPMSFSPLTGLVYVPAQEIPLLYSADEQFSYQRKGWNTGIEMARAGMPDDQAVREQMGQLVKGHVSAWDPVAGKERWRIQHSNIWNGGLLSTAGNLLFQGNAEAEFAAYRADTGEELWSAPTQTGVVAAPISYAVDGVQYVAVAAGWGGAFPLSAGETASRSKGVVSSPRVLVYRLDGGAELPAMVAPVVKAPDQREFQYEKSLVERGHALYMSSCHMCHGDRAVSASVIPDLRFMSAETREQFLPIVLGGLRHQKGMVGFADSLDMEQAMAIYNYLEKRAEDAAEGRD
ncbi:PQQ-dependent dehydrogenase, methanol/ethanol family [Parahaliea aestuarii]|uniref:PQQ-dependent dehydrogenase, methanol/ethanol family n=1 Tax=Parahaliea aestuarii TaxID=1852021 RepID=A0A5C8ZL54_9GAMM|nr:PQQ-dependent dehydrogenase, methanol/ethanol family [Parahaliea aestuarii]TXS89193.1 PQQ-dependent dehydrogenase, methanol/ethanol family [Parahaliea aestuarii]